MPGPWDSNVQEYTNKGSRDGSQCNWSTPISLLMTITNLFSVLTTDAVLCMFLFE